MKKFSMVFMIIGLVIQSILLLVGLALARKYYPELLMIAVVLVSSLVILSVVYISELGGKISDIDERLKKLQQEKKE